MKIDVLDHGFVRLVESWGGGDYNNDPPILETENESGIIEAARQSTQGSFRGWEKDEKLLKYLFENKHATPFEFSGMVIEVKAPLFVFREWHRHRTQSYNEMSARYAPLPSDDYMPTVERCLHVNEKNKQAGALKNSQELTHSFVLNWLAGLENLYNQFDDHYQDGLKNGIPKEIARCGMPVGRYSQMRATTNLRNWLGFLTLRMSPHAQWEIRQFANAVAKVIEQEFPRTYSLFAENNDA